MNEIDESFQHIEKLAQLAKESTHVEEVSRLQTFLSISPEQFKDQAALPCVILPPSKFSLSRSYNRQNLLHAIENHFRDSTNKFSTIALHGLGGVGKSHIAMKYAYTHIQSYSAMLWIYCETRAAIEQSFTDIAVRLQLPTAAPGNHAENRIQVLTWLQQTSMTAINGLILDVAETSF